MTPAERDPRTHAIIGAAMEAHNELGPGFLEPVYQEALAIKLQRRPISHERAKELRIVYKGAAAGQKVLCRLRVR